MINKMFNLGLIWFTLLMGQVNRYILKRRRRELYILQSNNLWYLYQSTSINQHHTILDQIYKPFHFISRPRSHHIIRQTSQPNQTARHRTKIESSQTSFRWMNLKPEQEISQMDRGSDPWYPIKHPSCPICPSTHTYQAHKPHREGWEDGNGTWSEQECRRFHTCSYIKRFILMSIDRVVDNRPTDMTEIER